MFLEQNKFAYQNDFWRIMWHWSRADPPYTQNTQAAQGPQNTRGTLALKDVLILD